MYKRSTLGGSIPGRRQVGPGYFPAGPPVGRQVTDPLVEKRRGRRRAAPFWKGMRKKLPMGNRRVQRQRPAKPVPPRRTRGTARRDIPFKSVRSSLGKRIQRLRERKHLTQEQFARASGLRCAYVGRIEQGDHNVRLGTLVSVARALGMTVTKLVEGVF
jgi:DNA-binding XRE family transcriptional regulator